MANSHRKLIQLGEFMYRYRALIAVPFFIILVIFSRPYNPSVLPIIFLLIGMTIRIWAAGYIGASARGNTFSGQHMIISGPYHYVRHPLYCGNFFLVLSVIILFNPPTVLAVLLFILFIIEYTIIIMSEQHYVQSLPKEKVHFNVMNLRGELSTLVVLGLIYCVSVVRKVLIPF
jgi:protein-S-isoprenylcysteine O-methyltransferase Ste14